MCYLKVFTVLDKQGLEVVDLYLTSKQDIVIHCVLDLFLLEVCVLCVTQSLSL